METSALIFYIVATLMLVFGVLTVTSRRFFRAAVYLLAVLLLTSGIYFILEFNFIAIAQIMIYVGGIVVLILFSILLTQTADNKVDQPGIWKMMGAFLTAGSGFILTTTLVLNHLFTHSTQVVNLHIDNIGKMLLNTGNDGYIPPFELVTILLLAAMIGSIIVAFKSKKEEQEQSISETTEN
ncbi:MAG: NADH-quinone oxidoreductase subunit J family protein [Bacteroidia bacterium]